MTTDLGKLTTAAATWDGMAKQFKDQETAYGKDVHGITLRPTFQGVSQEAANRRFGLTLDQYKYAQAEAKAIASILREAHTQFVDLRKKLESARDDAIAKGMAVSDQGVVTYDTSKLSQGERMAYVHDPDYQESVRKTVGSWQELIDRCVSNVGDADKNVEIALQGVVTPPDGLGSNPKGFNGKAMNDIEKYEAKEADDIATRVANGEKVSAADLAELRRVLTEEKGNKEFSQTFLDGLGPDRVIKLTNRFDDLAYFDDTHHKSTYLEINGGLADVLATATKVPDFKDANGKHLRFGTPAYNEAFTAWTKTKDARFYNSWRRGLRECGDGAYDLKVAGESVGKDFKGHGQRARGYQSLATLMQQGHGFSPQFVADVTDDMIAAEKKTPDIWDLYGRFDKKDGNDWFANDPVDGALEIMSRNPEGSAGYLDPGTSVGKERLDYLLGHGHGSRDWNITNTTAWSGHGQDIERDTGDVEDSDNRQGLGDVLTAAATGVDPHGPRPLGPTSHSDANNRVFVHALDVLSGQGDDMPASLRDDMAKIMTNHGHETYAAMADTENRHGSHGPKLDRSQVMDITKQISRSQYSYGLLHEGMNYAIADDLHDRTRPPEDTLGDAGYAVGFMEQARYEALKSDQHDYTWDKAWSYHVVGGLINFVPEFGDGLQRGVDALTTAWIMDEQKHQADKLTSDSQATYNIRQNQLNAIARQWYSVNSDWASHHTGYSRDDGVYKMIAATANDGNARARGLLGDQ
ncbi:hypothetical protein ABZ845_04540 [Streptomyces sp. NPDC047022]|uniref:hypothetical protein n=1 Tax=Streptomyces sp. NPDC047022 TaxID=3155737 RepID=UPI0033F22DA2